MNKKIKLLELFGGIGSIRLALINLGFEVEMVDYVDNYKYAVEYYNNAFNENFLPQDIQNWKLKKASEIDILMHGSPCQDFSKANKYGKILKNKSLLYKETIDIIKNKLSLKPKIIIWENVKGLLHNRNIKYLQDYLVELELIGYKNYYKILNARDFGIPQNRERIFVISILKNFKEFDFNKLIKMYFNSLDNFLDKNVDNKYFLKIEDFKFGLNEIKKYSYSFNKFLDFKNFINVPRNSDGQLINGSYNRIWKIDNYLENLTCSRRTKIMVESKNLIKNEIPIFIIDNNPYNLRILTEKECLRLMGQSEENIIKNLHLPSTHLYKLAGNAIVVNVLESILKELLK